MKITLLGTSHGLCEGGRYNTSTLFEVGGRFYIVDAGAPIDALFDQSGRSLGDLYAVFITHMHDDHLFGLTNVPVGAERKQGLIKRPLQLLFPSERGAKAYLDWLSVCHTDTINKIDVKWVTDDGEVCYDDGVLSVVPLSTRHIDMAALYPDHSHAYVLCAEGKRVLVTGDLKSDFSDYEPLIRGQHYDVVISELTHFSAEKNLALLKSTDTDRLIFTHSRTALMKEILEHIEEFSFPVAIGKDGETWNI